MSSMRFCCAILLALVQVGLPRSGEAYGQDAPSSAPAHVWTLRNQCHEPLRIAVHYQQVEGRVVTQGWWSIAPQAEVRIGMRSEWIGYFAVSASENLFWWNPEGPKFGIDRARNFEYPGDGQRQGATVTGFHWISVIREPVTTLTCR